MFLLTILTRQQAVYLRCLIDTGSEPLGTTLLALNIASDASYNMLPKNNDVAAENGFDSGTLGLLKRLFQ